MRSLVIKTAVNAAALWAATQIIPDFGVTQSRFQNQIATFLVLGLLFGLVNAALKPLADFLTLPFRIVTLGLFVFVVNAFMLKVLEWISAPLGFDFNAGDFFWTTIAAAVVTTVVSMVLNLVLPDGKKKD